MDNVWDEKSLRARVSNFDQRLRYEAASPNKEEIKAYERALSFASKCNKAVVLGMTPELRLIATNRFRKVVTIDCNKEAIAFYKDWIPFENRKKENIVEGNWLDLSSILNSPVSCVLGDGVFGNILKIEGHSMLLKNISSVLAEDGNFIVRKAMIPKRFVPSTYRASILLDKFRSGMIDDAEFGFGVRLLGHYECCYDVKSCLLDNRKLFNECRKDFEGKRINEREYSCIKRYYFGGKNCIIPQETWEAILARAGFASEVYLCHGKMWYDYYKIYNCKKDLIKEGQIA